MKKLLLSFLLATILPKISFSQNKPVCYNVTDKGLYIEIAVNKSFETHSSYDEREITHVYNNYGDDDDRSSYDKVLILKKAIVSVTISNRWVRIFINDISGVSFYWITTYDKACNSNVYEQIERILSSYAQNGK